MDAWIEILLHLICVISDGVASYMDAWIEIQRTDLLTNRLEVASYMDAWIEIRNRKTWRGYRPRRILYERMR